MSNPSGKNGPRWSAVEDAELRCLWRMKHQDGVTAFCRRAGAVLRRPAGGVMSRLEFLGLHRNSSVRLARSKLFFRPPLFREEW